MSKIGATVMCIIQQREMDAAGAEDIVINSVSCYCTALIDVKYFEFQYMRSPGLTIYTGSQKKVYTFRI